MISFQKKYKTIWTEDLRNIELNALPVYDDSYIVVTNINFILIFNTITILSGVECESIISIDYLLVYENKYNLQIY